MVKYSDLSDRYTFIKSQLRHKVQLTRQLMNWLAILAVVLLGYLAMIMKARQQFTSVLLLDSY